MMNVKRINVLIVSLLLVLSCSSTQSLRPSPNQNQSKKNSLKLWDEKDKLVWDDYQGKVNTSPLYNDYDAITTEFFKVNIINEGINEIVYSIDCYFDKKESWSRDKKSNSLLKHEQLHFDIAELYTRKTRKFYSEYEWTNQKSCNEILSKVFDRIIGDEMKTMQFEYDEETNHGAVTMKQLEWEKKIAQELKDMAEYSDPKVVLKRKR